MSLLAKASEAQRRKRKELSRLCSMANKRVQLLERKGLETPAIIALKDNTHFGVGHKKVSNKEINNEWIRVNNFLDSLTSTYRGAQKYIKQVAELTGYKGKSNKELKEHATMIFNLVNRVKEIVEQQEDAYYTSWRILNAVKMVVQDNKNSFDELDDYDDRIQAILDSLDSVDKVNQGEEGFADDLDSNNWDFIREKK